MPLATGLQEIKGERNQNNQRMRSILSLHSLYNVKTRLNSVSSLFPCHKENVKIGHLSETGGALTKIQMPVDGWNCNPQSYTDCSFFPQGGATPPPPQKW